MPADLTGYDDTDLEHDLARDANRWRSLGRPRELLWRGQRLAHAERWRARTRHATDTEKLFLEAARAAVTWQRRGWLAAAVVMVSSVALAGSLARKVSRTERRSWAHAEARWEAGARVEQLASLARQRELEAGVEQSLARSDPNAALARLSRLAVSPENGCRAVRALQQGASWVLEGHSGAVGPVAWSPDGRTLATVSGDRAVRLWRTDDGTVRELRAPRGRVELLAWSPDGASLALGGAETPLTVVDAATGSERALPQPPREAVALAWSPDGRTLATQDERGLVRLWDATRNESRALSVTSRGVYGLAWSPDGRTLALPDGAGVVVTSPSTGLTHRLRGPGGDDTLTLGFSPDGRALAVGGGEGSLVLWDTLTRRPSRVLARRGRDASMSIRALSWSPDGRSLATRSAQGSVRVWVVDAGMAWQFQLTPSSYLLAWSPDGRTLAAADDRTLWLRDTRTGEERRLQGHARSVASLSWSPDGRALLTGSWDRTARVWDLASEPSRVLADHQPELRACLSDVGAPPTTELPDASEPPRWTEALWRSMVRDRTNVRADDTGAVSTEPFRGLPWR